METRGDFSKKASYGVFLTTRHLQVRRPDNPLSLGRVVRESDAFIIYTLNEPGYSKIVGSEFGELVPRRYVSNGKVGI